MAYRQQHYYACPVKTGCPWALHSSRKGCRRKHASCISYRGNHLQNFQRNSLEVTAGKRDEINARLKSAGESEKVYSLNTRLITYRRPVELVEQVEAELWVNVK